MTVPPRAWDVALAAVLLTSFVALIGFETDISILAALILAVAVLIWLTGRMLARIAHVLFGSNVVARILAFGIAIAVFPEMVVAPFGAAAALVRYLSQMAPVMATAWPQLDAANPQTLAVVGKFVEGLLAALKVPLRSMIFGFVTWVALGHLLSLVFERGQQIGAAVKSAATRVPERVAAGAAPVYSAFRAIPPTFWPNATVVITLAFGIYLILGAIATIPYLSQESIPIDEMTARLARTLDGLKRTEAQFTTLHPVNLTDADPVAQLKEFIAVPAPVDGAAVKPAVTPAAVRTDGAPSGAAPAPEISSVFESAIRDEIRQQIMQSEQIHTAARSKWTRTRQDTLNAETNLRTDLAAQFTSSVSTLRGTGEQTRYLDAVRLSYSSELENIDQTLDDCQNAVQDVDGHLQEAGASTISRVKLLRLELATYGDSGIDPRLATTIASALRDRSLGTQNVDPFCQPYKVIFVPTLPQRGSGWGPLANIFDWLLATDSLDVVVIIGMLGAGLFGSAVGTFVAASVRKKDVSIGNAPLSHLIRSFAATMVVYLGLKTGVAFAAVGNPNPDPYLMLFLCFIGTVYSDDVWKWAKRTGEGYWKAEGTDAAADKNKDTTPQGDPPNP